LLKAGSGFLAAGVLGEVDAIELDDRGELVPAAGGAAALPAASTPTPAVAGKAAAPAPAGVAGKAAAAAPAKPGSAAAKGGPAAGGSTTAAATAATPVATCMPSFGATDTDWRSWTVDKALSDALAKYGLPAAFGSISASYCKCNRYAAAAKAEHLQELLRRVASLHHERLEAIASDAAVAAEWRTTWEAKVASFRAMALAAAGRAAVTDSKSADATAAVDAAAAATSAAPAGSARGAGAADKPPAAGAASKKK